MINKPVDFGKDYLQCQKDMEDWIFLGGEEKKKAINRLLETWDISLFMQVIFENYSQKQCLFARYLKECNVLKTQCVQSRRIAVYYYKYGKGGVERVLSYLLPLYVQAGYSVVFITDEEPQAGDYLLPPEVKRYAIPRRQDILSGKKDCNQRISRLLEILKKEQIDTLCYHAASNPLLFYDLVAAKSTGVKVILSKHELFSQHMVMGKDVLTNEMSIYPLSDMLTVLSREEEMFWKILGVKGYMIPNPIGESYTENYKYHEESVNIVWVGRLDFYQKRYQDIVPIMQEVVKELPGCIINIYGSPEGYRDTCLLETQIRESGLEKNIRYQGYCADVEQIYKDAGVLLIISAYESSPMIILESKQLGIPLVTYSMPYLELLKNGKGFVEVEQGDILAAAKALIKILSDKELKRKLSREAKESISEYSNIRTMEKWEKVFSSSSEIWTSVSEGEWEDSYSTILKTLIFHQSKGCQRYEALRESYRQLRVENKLNQIKNIYKTGKRKLALYPYGTLGKEIRSLIENEQMDISLIVDNKLANKEDGVVTVEALKKIEVQAFLFIICSNSFDIYDEIRFPLYEVVPQENIFDWFPRDEERF